MIPACKAAVNDFLAARGLSPEIYPIDGVGVYFRKGKVAATTGYSVAFDRWSDRAQWTDDSTLRTANFEFSCSVSQYGCETDGRKIDRGYINILKDRNFLEIYLDLLDGIDPKNILEIGFFQGGMPLFLCDMMRPEKIVGIDRHPPSENLTEIIERSGFKDCVKLYGGILQDDTPSIKELLNLEFGGEPLDIIIDDCSHEYRNSKTLLSGVFWLSTYWGEIPNRGLGLAALARHSMANEREPFPRANPDDQPHLRIGNGARLISRSRIEGGCRMQLLGGRYARSGP